MDFLRLTKRVEFVSVSKHKRAAFSSYFIVQYLHKPGQAHPRFGLTVSRRVGNAVVRNRIKRRLREVIRMTLATSKALYDAPFDFVIIPKRSVESVEFKQLCKIFSNEVDGILQLPPQTSRES